MKHFLLVWIISSLFLSASATGAEFQFHLAGGPGEGALVVYVFEEPNHFAKLREPVLTKHFEIRNADAVYQLTDVPAGEYAVLVFLDENRNGILDRNFSGIPREPIAFSNNYRPKGPPSFSQARIHLAADQTLDHTFSLFRPLGRFGQIGVGLAVMTQSSPYAGSDSARVLPIPAVVYIGEKLQVLGPMVNYTLAGSDKVRLAFRGRLRMGAYDEDDSPLLEGLRDRKSTFMAGLALSTDLPGGLDLSLSYSHDLLDRIGGGTASAQLGKGFQFNRWRISPSVSANWLDSEIANYDFGVPATAARPDRPAYDVGSAVNWAVGLSGFYEISPQWHLVVGVTREQLDSDISDSPIVDKKYLLRSFSAVSYIF